MRDGWKIYIAILSLAVISLGNSTVYKITVAPLHEGAAIMPVIELILNARSLFSFISTFTFARTLFILWSGSTLHTFYKIRLSVVLRICESFTIILSHLSLLCLCL